MTWRGISVKQTTKRGAQETRKLWKKQPWAHSVGPFHAGAIAPTEPNPPPFPTPPPDCDLPTGSEHAGLCTESGFKGQAFPNSPLPLVW